MPELDFNTVNSTVDPATDLTAAWNKPSKAVDLAWTKPGFGQIRSYFIYRLLGTFHPVTNPLTKATLVVQLQGAPPTTSYSDSKVKANTTYTYYVVAALADGRKSGASNLAVVFTK